MSRPGADKFDNFFVCRIPEEARLHQSMGTRVLCHMVPMASEDQEQIVGFPWIAMLDIVGLLEGIETLSNKNGKLTKNNCVLGIEPG